MTPHPPSTPFLSRLHLVATLVGAISLLVLVAALWQLWQMRPGGISADYPAVSTPAADSTTGGRPQGVLPVRLGRIELSVGAQPPGTESLPPVPHRLQLGETNLRIRTVSGPVADWLQAPLGADEALWLEGSVINYVLRLPDAADRLPHGQVVLALDHGDPLLFALAPVAPRVLSRLDAVLGQGRPELTLVWHDGKGSLLAATATWLPNPVTAAHSLLTESNALTGVVLTAVTLSADGMALVVEGEWTGGAGTVLTDGEIRLEAGGIQARLLEAQPPLPWVISADSPAPSQPFVLTLQRPPAPRAQLVIAGHGFELTNVR